MAGLPWSELGLDGPADERTIRRAYAARLKIVRPDLDPAGFQRLVQARDAALRALEQAAPWPLPQPAPPPDLVPKRERATPQSRTPQPDSPADTDRPDDTPPDEMPPPLDIERAAGSELPPAARQPPATEPGATPPPNEPAIVDQPQAAAGPETVSMLLSAFVEAWRQGQVLPPVAPILKGLGEQSLVARQKLEIEALRAVAGLLDKSLFEGKMAEARRLAARSLILGLDDEYGWASSDRRLQEMMPRAAADQIGRLLRVVREWEKTGLTPKFASSDEVKKRGRREAAWIFAGAGLLLFAIIRATTPTPAPTYTSMVVSDTYSRVMQLTQISAAIFFNQGVAYDNNGQVDSAIQQYSEAIRLSPNYPLAFYNRGLDYASKGEFDRAIRDYDLAILLKPGDPDHFVSRGVAWSGKGQYDRAIQDYDQAIRLRPDDALAFVDRGVAHADKGEYDRAIQDYDAAIRIDPKDPDAWHNRGLAKQAKGDIAAGNADIAKATQLTSPPPPASPQSVAGKR